MSRARCSDLPIDSRGGSHGGSKLTRGIDDKVKGVDHKVGSVIQGELYPH